MSLFLQAYGQGGCILLQAAEFLHVRIFIGSFRETSGDTKDGGLQLQSRFFHKDAALWSFCPE